MREALALVAEEGLEVMWARHTAAHKQLWEGLGAMGLEPFVANPSDRLITVNTIKVCGRETGADHSDTPGVTALRRSLARGLVY
jgi:aspartate aminotransferase-like enzyme